MPNHPDAGVDLGSGPDRSVEQARCGLCDRWIDETWEEHQASEEHRANLRNDPLLAERLARYRSGLQACLSGARTEEGPQQ